MVTAVSFRKMCKTYRSGTQALRGLNLDIRQGEFFGLLGLNGAGKTTSINVIAGLVRLNSGQVLVHDFDAVKQYRQVHRLVGIAPQEIVLDSRFLNVRQILIYSAGYFGIGAREARRRADALLDEFGLWEKRHAAVRDLSGGMKRRLSLVKALIHDPPILILDEPTAGADVALRYQIWEKMTSLNGQGKTILLTTHYLEEAERLCERVAIIHHGQVVRSGVPEELIHTSIPDQIMILTDPPLKEVPRGIPEGVRPAIVDGKLRLDGTLHEPQVLEALARLDRRGITIRSVELQKARLEDVFLELTQPQENLSS